MGNYKGCPYVDMGLRQLMRDHWPDMTQDVVQTDLEKDSYHESRGSGGDLDGLSIPVVQFPLASDARDDRQVVGSACKCIT